MKDKNGRKLPKPTDDRDRKLLADVQDPGWHVIGIEADDEGPSFAYSIEIYHTFSHPEIIVFGLDIPVMHCMINAIGERVTRSKIRTNPMKCWRTVKSSSGRWKRNSTEITWDTIVGSIKEISFRSSNAFGPTRSIAIRGIPKSVKRSWLCNRCFPTTNRGNSKRARTERPLLRSLCFETVIRSSWSFTMRRATGNSCAGPRTNKRTRKSLAWAPSFV